MSSNTSYSLRSSGYPVAPASPSIINNPARPKRNFIRSSSESLDINHSSSHLSTPVRRPYPHQLSWSPIQPINPVQFNITPESKMNNIDSKTRIKVKSFSGGDDVDIWSHKFTQAAATNGWSDATRLLQLPNYLDGSAFRWYQMQPDPVKEDYAAIMQALINYYKTDVKILKNQFYQRKQFSGETLDHYYRDMVDLVQQLGTPVDEDVKLRTFINGLYDAKLCQKVLDADATSMKEAFEKARQFEYSRQAVKLSHPAYRAAAITDAPSELAMLLNEIREMKTQIANLQLSTIKPVTNGPNNNSRPDDTRPVCLYCKKVGHTIAKCYSKQNADKRAAGKSSSQSTSQSNSSSPPKNW
jgi:hypothetical protein